MIQGQQPEQHCFGTADMMVTYPDETNFDPANPTANLDQATHIEHFEQRGGCSDTAAEAVCASTDGVICPPLDATNQEIDWAIRDWQYHELGIDDNPGPWGWTPPDQRG